MAWLRSEQSLLHHPKTKLLQSYLNATLPETIGKLHMLWYWCLDYALDGDLSRKEPKMIEQSCDIPLKLLVKAGFVDSRPYRRIHDWWQIQGNYLKIRFKNQPENWQRIENLYKRSLEPSMHRSVEPSRGGSNSMDVQYNTNGRTERTDGREKQYSQDASRPAPGGASAPLKSFEEAGDDEVCAPPKNMWDKVKKGMKPNE
jgi:hypothetical protein